MSELPNEWHCPKCGRRLEASGAVVVDGEACPVFQCDDCVMDGGMFGEVAYTFAVDGTGKPFDPAEGVEGL